MKNGINHVSENSYSYVISKQFEMPFLFYVPGQNPITPFVFGLFFILIGLLAFYHIEKFDKWIAKKSNLILKFLPELRVFNTGKDYEKLHEEFINSLFFKVNVWLIKIGGVVLVIAGVFLNLIGILALFFPQ